MTRTNFETKLCKTLDFEKTMLDPFIWVKCSVQVLPNTLKIILCSTMSTNIFAITLSWYLPQINVCIVMVVVVSGLNVCAVLFSLSVGSSFQVELLANST